MNIVRQLGSGLLYALVSVVLVVGGLSLALAESNGASPTSPTASPSQSAEFVIVPTTSSPTSASFTSTGTATPNIVTLNPGVTVVNPTAYFPTANPTIYYFPPLPTNTTTYACGPFSGWVRGYVIRPGDTLFHIATMYRTTVASLERANCKSNSIIYPGDRLWVPNVPTITPGVTIIPTFATPTDAPTEPLTLTPLPYTETVLPTSTTDTGQPQNP
jgi:LysM repeat protein